MEFLIFLVVAVAALSGLFWARKYFRHEIERAKRINRSRKNQ